MLTKEELESWNELFPDCEIRETDLSNPTQSFVKKTFVAYLQKFGFELAEDCSSEDSEKRLFLIKLTQRIQFILKITDQSLTFYYYDLLRPTPKKISHTLGILLNYLYYYNMYKTDVFKMVNERINFRQDLKSRIEKFREDNEIANQRAREIMEKISELMEQVLPKRKHHIKEFTAQNTQLKAEQQHLQESIKELGSQVLALEKQEFTLKTQIVTKNEACELHTQQAKLQEIFTENLQTINACESKLKEHLDQIRKLEDLLQNVKETKKVLPLELLENSRKLDKKLADTKSLLTSLERKKEDILQKLAKQQNELQCIEKKLQLEKKLWEEEMANKTQTLENMAQLLNDKTTELSTLQAEEHSLQCEIAQEVDISVYLHNHINELHKNISYKNGLSIRKAADF